MTSKIGRLSLTGKSWLAPMAGVSDVAFRALCKIHGASATPTEFLSANALARAEPRVTELTQTAEEEDVRIIQIFGQNTTNLAKATEWITEQNRFHCIDMNLGCPSPKVLLQGAGSALLRKPFEIPAILTSIIDNTNLPVSIKIRTGMNQTCNNGWEIIKLAQDLNINHVTIHARSVAQGYGGKADWNYIKKATDHFDIPIIANGDIVDGNSAKHCLEQTNAKAVMIGRAARGNPFVFNEINKTLEQEQYTKPTPLEHIQAFFDYVKLYNKYNVNDVALLKSHAMQFTKGLTGGAQARSLISQTKTEEELKACFDDLHKTVEGYT